jgi:hypothetical protein
MKSDNDNGIRDGVLFLELLQCGYVNRHKKTSKFNQLFYKWKCYQKLVFEEKNFCVKLWKYRIRILLFTKSRVIEVKWSENDDF